MSRLVIGLLAVGLVLAGTLLALVIPRHCGVNRVAFERLKPGMTSAEVEAILGGPEGDYRTRPPSFWIDLTGGSIDDLDWTMWRGDEGEVYLGFNHDGHLVGIHFSEAPPPRRGLVALIRWRLGQLVDRLLPGPAAVVDPDDE
jgi:hypothetical protein